jgi:sulfite reductase (NADPH) hemoprotein beta-component
MTEKIVTANRLSDGAVVYLQAGGKWGTQLTEALIVGDADQEAAALRLAADAHAENLVIGAYAMAVETENGAAKPTSQRERIRHLGPTVWSGEIMAARANGAD